jgi:hypothetical protein
MKKNTIIFGLLVMAMGFGLVGCATINRSVDSMLATKWDKERKKVAENAFLYFDDGVKLHSVNGVDNLNPLTKQPQAIRGNGTVKRPKMQVGIPAGPSTLAISISDGTERTYRNDPQNLMFDFGAKKYYQITAKIDFDRIHPITEPLIEEVAKSGNVAETTRFALELAGRLIPPLNIEIYEITTTFFGSKRTSVLKFQTPGQLLDN